MTRRATWLLRLVTTGLFLPASVLSQTTADSQAQDVTRGEVVVTARKVRENVQNIPMSVQAMSADFLQEAAATRLYELQFNIPGLVLNSTGFQGAGFSLRGVADQLGTGLSVATHLDGVYLGSANLAITRMFDLERIEILKGPQGTLYGRNATGGSINFITKTPGSEYSAAVEAAYGSFDTARIQGHLNVPLGETAFRFAFIGSEGDGYIRNSLDDRRFAENDFWGLRGSFHADMGDRLSVDLMAQRVEDDGASGELWMPPPPFLADPSDIRLATVVLADPYMFLETDNAGVTIEYDYGFATLHSVTGYARSSVRDLDDCSGTDRLMGCVRSATPARYDQWSQEVRLASRGNASFDWLIGGNYLAADAFRRFYALIPFRHPAPTNDYVSDTDQTASAVFGQATLHLGRSRITGGLRLTHEEMRVSDIGTGEEDNHTLTAVEDEWDGTSWRIDFEHAASDDVLIYAGVSTGFKSGGITTERLPGGGFDGFGPEKLTAIEWGLKGQWLNRRLTVNAAAFHYNFEDMQTSSVSVVGVLETYNAARAESYGVDATAEFRFSDRLTLSGGAVWMPGREFVEYRNDRTDQNLSGNKLSRAPKWSATAAIGYARPVRDVGKVSSRLEYNFRSAFFFSETNDPFQSQQSFGLLNLFLRFEPSGGKWYVFASGRNLTNAKYFNQILLQASPGYPDTYEMGFGTRF